jgi:hypothetical protein
MDPRLDNWGGPGYAEYQGYMKVSGAEKTAHNQTADEASYLQNMMKTQFSEQQNLLNNVLIPQLTHMATNPQGFGAQALAAMRSQTINTIGGQLASQQQNLRQQFATQNMAGLGSGVQAALGANLAQGAAGQEASGLQNIAIANAQAQMQQQQFALGGLGSASQLLGQAPESAKLGLEASGQSFNQAYTMSQQGGFWSNLARSALTAAGTAFAGPLGGMAGNFVGNLFGGSGPTSSPWSTFTPGTMGQPAYAPGTDLSAPLPPSPLAMPSGSFGAGPPGF